MTPSEKVLELIENYERRILATRSRTQRARLSVVLEDLIREFNVKKAKEESSV